MQLISDEMDDIIKIVKSLEESGLLIKGVSKIIKNEAKERKDELLGILLGTLTASLLVNMFASKGVVRGGDVVIRVDDETNRVGESF